MAIFEGLSLSTRNRLSGLPALSMRVAIKDSAAGMAFRHQKKLSQNLRWIRRSLSFAPSQKKKCENDPIRPLFFYVFLQISGWFFFDSRSLLAFVRSTYILGSEVFEFKSPAPYLVLNRMFNFQKPTAQFQFPTNPGGSPSWIPTLGNLPNSVSWDEGGFVAMKNFVGFQDFTNFSARLDSKYDSNVDMESLPYICWWFLWCIFLLMSYFEHLVFWASHTRPSCLTAVIPLRWAFEKSWVNAFRFGRRCKVVQRATLKRL